jgi:hypothetical protein
MADEQDRGRTRWLDEVPPVEILDDLMRHVRSSGPDSSTGRILERTLRGQLERVGRGLPPTPTAAEIAEREAAEADRLARREAKKQERRAAKFARSH